MSEEFFVGYLPTPLRLRRFLLIIIAWVVLIALLLGAVMAAKQQDPGEAVWDLSDGQALEGVLHATPYPLLVVTRGEQKETVLLVNEGKVGAADEQVSQLDRRLVRVPGHVLERGGRRLLEVTGSIEALSKEAQPELDVRAGGELSVSGEIIDPKCFSGAMKRGEGKTHKACAALCLRGGIPPMLLTASGQQHLLLDEQGQRLKDNRLQQVIELVGEPVAIDGEACEAEGLLMLRVAQVKPARP